MFPISVGGIHSIGSGLHSFEALFHDFGVIGQLVGLVAYLPTAAKAGLLKIVDYLLLGVFAMAWNFDWNIWLFSIYSFDGFDHLQIGYIIITNAIVAKNTPTFVFFEYN